jgi:hypothetical protein
MRCNSDDKFRFWASDPADRSVCFLSFAIFTFFAMEAEHGLGVTECEAEGSCVRVLINFYISHTRHYEGNVHRCDLPNGQSWASRISALVQKLISQRSIIADAHADI